MVTQIQPAVSRFRWGKLNLGDLACVIIPALAFLQLHVIGSLFATDFALLAVLPFSLARHHEWLSTRVVSMFLGLCLVWLLAQIATDMIVGSTPEDYLRGWLKITLTITHFTAIALLVRESVKRATLFGAGLIIGDVLTYFLNPNELATAEPWKFGLGMPITMVCFLGAGIIAPRRRITAVTIMVTVAALNIVMGFRSIGGICLVTAIFAYFHLSPNLSDRRLGKLRWAIIFAGLGLGMWGLMEIYAFTASSGWLGEDIKWKYSLQSGGSGGILIGGRSDLLGAWAAIADSPIIGHGSWAKDPQYAALVHEQLADRGFASANVAGTYDSDLIPSHSHIFGAWVESGIIGAMFWVWVLCIPVMTLARATGREPLLAFFVLMTTTLIWHILFSPYAGYMRVITTYFLYATIVFGRHSRARQFQYA